MKLNYYSMVMIYPQTALNLIITIIILQDHKMDLLVFGPLKKKKQLFNLPNAHQGNWVTALVKITKIG